MQLQPGIFSMDAEDYPRAVEVREASVRATHTFVTEDDIQFFKPLVRDALPNIPHLACVRDEQGLVAGFIAVADRKVEMLFLHPQARQGRRGPAAQPCDRGVRRNLARCE